MMHRSSMDMIAWVDEIGGRLRHVPENYAKKKCGLGIGQQMLRPGQNPLVLLPDSKNAAIWIRTFLQVFKRFKAGDHRHSSEEVRDIADLAQWLANLHAEAEGHPPVQLTVREDDLIVRERIIG